MSQIPLHYGFKFIETTIEVQQMFDTNLRTALDRDSPISLVSDFLGRGTTNLQGCIWGRGGPLAEPSPPLRSLKLCILQCNYIKHNPRLLFSCCKLVTISFWSKKCARSDLRMFLGEHPQTSQELWYTLHVQFGGCHPMEYVNGYPPPSSDEILMQP